MPKQKTPEQLQKHIGKRTGIDFSKHEVIVTQNEFVNIWFLKKPNTLCDCIKFINTNGILAVTGDYGNWIFCREFHPDAKGYVETGYWKEKLRISSTQEPSEYDPEGTAVALQEQLIGLEEYGYKDKKLQEMKEYIQECLTRVDNEHEYVAYAYLEGPSFIDSESVIMVKKIKYWLLVVFDGFDEICNRLRNPETQDLPIDIPLPK